MVKLLTAGNIAAETGIPETTVRRYLTIFDEFFLSRKIGRATKYDPSSVELIQKIYNLYTDGFSTEDIRGQLSQEESYAPAVVSGSSDSVVVVTDNMPPSLMNQVAAVVEKLVNQKTEPLKNRIEELEQAQEQLAAEKETLQQTIKQFDEEQKIAVAELSRRINERDSKLIETMRKMMEEKKPWWKRIF